MYGRFNWLELCPFSTKIESFFWLDRIGELLLFTRHSATGELLLLVSTYNVVSTPRHFLVPFLALVSFTVLLLIESRDYYINQQDEIKRDMNRFRIIKWRTSSASSARPFRDELETLIKWNKSSTFSNHFHFSSISRPTWTTVFRFWLVAGWPWGVRKRKRTKRM